MEYQSALTAAEQQIYELIHLAGPRPSAGATVATRSPAVPTDGDDPIVLPEPRAGRIAATLRARRSRKDVMRPLPAQDLGEFLHAACAPLPDGRRPYPSSGGLADISFLALVHAVPGLPRGGYLVTEDVRLRRLPRADAFLDAYLIKVAQFLGLGWDQSPAVVVLLMCRWTVIAAKYANCTLLTGFWDAGAALQTLYVAAAELDLPGTACAALAPQALGRVLGVPHGLYGHVGAYALGGPAAVRPSMG